MNFFQHDVRRNDAVRLTWEQLWIRDTNTSYDANDSNLSTNLTTTAMITALAPSRTTDTDSNLYGYYEAYASTRSWDRGDSKMLISGETSPAKPILWLTLGRLRITREYTSQGYSE